ncbi:polycystin-1-like protein 2 [Physella acuta]|uniref:polycystin-1-like protein 2 n=1 Tax=Physella acuta TaxID=109671 RepID=UPI0027DBF943|nr:polycystin-1-like protein 2 [Physella acuta]
MALTACSVIQVSQSTNFPLRYSKTAEGISSNTNFVSINLFGANSSKLSVKDLVEPVKVVIPRDPKTSEPSYLTVNPMIPSWATLMNFVTNINRSHSSFHMDFQDMDGRQFLLVVKLGGLASIGNSTEFDKCDMVFLMPPNMTDKTDKNHFRFQLDNTVLGNFTGKLAIGIRELNDTEFDLDLSEGCLSLPRFENGTDSFRGLFSMRQYVTQCLAISDDEDDWSANGCVVGRETDVSKTVCYCTHLTTFAGGWVVVPNTIDWSYVFAHADFLSNPTIYITIILTGVLYLVGAIWARHRDKKISETLGIAPLADNDPKDRYFYEIIVSTGFRRNAGTDSQVCFVLSGEDDESDARVFTDSKRKIFRRGQLDGFLMSVPRPLGYLNFMRIWHDNSGRGKFASWYLNYIIVRDVQTDVKQVFIANRWFAVEEDDGQIDRVIPAASREQLGDFSYQFGERSRKNLVDGHLWFSVVARPPQSRFTCLQRVSCCLCLLYVSMLANAMFYRTSTSGTGETSSSSFSFGPFSIAPEQIFIGVVSNLIVFPVNFLLIYLFRKARPHHKRPSRIDLAIKEVIENNKQASINDVKPEVSSIFSVSKTPTLPKDPYATDSRPPTGMSYASTEQLTPKKKKKFELPWYFSIIAWILLWIVTLGSVVMVIFYGISFKDETCRKWITSLLVSFFTSVFITQPIKVFLFAMVLSLIFKNPSNEEEDEDDDEEQPQVDPDSELLHSDVVAATRPRKIGYKPPDPQMLERLRATRMKEIQMWAIIREVIIYSFFLWILMVISYRQLGAGNFLYKNNMKRVFIENLESDIDFYGLKNAKDFWDWTRSGLVNGLRAGPYSNGYPPLLLRAYINDKVSRILGYATIRQLRVKKNQCKVPDAVRGIIRECNVMYDMLDQEENSYTPGWGKALGRGAANTAEEYIYRDSSELNGYPYWGVLSMYSGGGYVAALNGSKSDLVETFNRLEAERWIDRYTRAVFVEFTVYNPQVNLFAISTILAEFDPSGGIVQTYRFEPAMLLPYMSSAMLFQLACEVIYLIFTLFFIIREGRELYKSRLTYFTSFWNLVEVGIIAMSLAAIVIYFYRLFVTNDLTSSFKSTHGNGYIKFQYVGYWNEMFSYMIGFLVFFATLKFLKLLRFNRKISMLSSILQHSAKGLLHFGLIFTIVFMAFTQLFYLTFMHIDIGYASFISAVVTTVLMMMGKFDIYSMIMTEPYLSQIFVLLYVIVVSFIIVNIFVSILNETFSAVREDVSKQGNEFEIVDFMLQRFKKWTGIGGSADQSEASPEQNGETNETKGEKSRDHIDDFPDRIEKLLKSISHVYNDQENYAMFYQKKPYAAPPLPSNSPAPPPQSSAPAGHVFRNNRSISPAPQARRRDSVIARVQTD